MHRFAVAMLIAAALPMAAAAQVPTVLGYQGRLFNADGSPATGVVEITFTVYEGLDSGAGPWSETQRVALSDGFYAVYLGSVTPLPAGLFDGRDLWLGLEVDGEALSPRQRIASVPYALTCTEARNVVGGVVQASSISVGGQTIVDDTGAWVGAATGLVGPQGPQGETGPQGPKGDVGPQGPAGPLMSCTASGQILKWNGTSWLCGADAAGLSTVASDASLTGDGTSGAPLGLATAGVGPQHLRRGGLYADLSRGIRPTVSAGTIGGFGPTSEYAAEGLWSTSTFPSSMTLDLGGVYQNIEQISFESHWRGDARYVPAWQGGGAYVLQYSQDGATWTTIPAVAPAESDVFIHRGSFANVRFVRLTVRAPATAGNPVHVGTFRVLSATYGDSSRVDARRLYNGVNVDGAGNVTIGGRLTFNGGTGPFCMFMNACPAGWTDRGQAGFIFNVTTGSCPFSQGSPYGGYPWYWCHPRLCCN